MTDGDVLAAAESVTGPLALNAHGIPTVFHLEGE